MKLFSLFTVAFAAIFCPQLHAFSIQHLITNVSCNGGSDGAINLTLSGGIQPYTFAWSNSAVTEDISGLSAGTYSVIVTDASPSTQTATFTITQPFPLVINATAVSPQCYDTPGGGSVIANMVQGSGPYTWTLNGPPNMTPTAADENFTWVRQGGGAGTLDNTALGVCSDKYGNVYATGEFYNTITLGNNVFTSAGNSDLFIARYTASGTLVWARRIGGIGYDSGMGIQCDTFGNIYVTGRFRNTATFGTYTLTSYDVDDTFIAKYDANGNCLWVYHPVSTSSDIGWSIDVDMDGNCYVSGYFTGNLTFSPLATMTSSSGFRIFVTKLNTSGVPVWSKMSVSTGANQGTGLAIDNSGNVFVTGFFSGTCSFGPYSVTSSGSRDFFIAKYNTSGTEQWARSATCTGNDEYGLDVCTDNAGNAYVTGYFRSTITFGTHAVTSAGADDVFLAKYNSSGTAQWAVRGGGSSIDRGHAVYCDENSNVYLTGFYYNTAIFGSFTLTPGGFNELFVARYNSNGVIQMIKGVNGVQYEQGHCIYNDHRGNTYVSGMFGATTSFGNISMTSYGFHDLFVSHFSMTDASDTVYNLPGGNYTAVVTDANGCTASAMVTIAQPSPIVVTPSVTQPLCSGGTGSATLAISGGTPTYTTNWGSANPNALVPGIYPVLITDASGCDTAINVTITGPPPVTATLSSTSPLCNGNCDGSISITASGGSPGYTYLWSNNSTNAVAGNLCAGTYSVTVTDGAGCTSMFSHQLTQPSALTTTSTISNATCFNSCNGSIALSPSGGTPGYTFLWSNSSTGNAVTSLCAGTYSATVTDGAGCTTTISAQITSPPALTTGVNTMNETCFNSCNGSIALSPSGGTPGYTFLWSNSSTGNVVSSLCTGTYSATITDGAGCSTTISTQITSPAALTAAFSTLDETCFNTCNGSIAATVSGGTLGYTLLWSNNSTGTIINALCAGTYTIIATDANGCTLQSAATIASPPQLLIANMIADGDTVCTGNCSHLAAIAAGGSPGYTYSWAPSVTLDNAAIYNPLACPTVTTTYTCSITDAQGCTTTDSVTVFVDICLAVAQQSSAKLLISPNPSSGIFILETADLVTFVIRDASGRIVEPVSIAQQNRIEIDLRECAAGIYFLEVHTADGLITSRKLVKQ